MTRVKGKARTPVRATASNPRPVIDPRNIISGGSDRVLRSHTSSRVTIPLPTGQTINSQTQAVGSASGLRRSTRRRRRAGADPWTTRRKKSTKPKRAPLPPPTHHTCRICVEEQPADQFIKWVTFGRGYHHNNNTEVPRNCYPHLSKSARRKSGPDPVCKTCIGASMAARLDTLGARAVSTGCLEPGCQNYWRFEDIIQFFPVAELERYNADMLTVFMQDNPNFICVNPSCAQTSLIDRFAPGYPHVACGHCSTRMCVSCNIPYHTGFTCAEYAARHINEAMTHTEKETLEIMQTKNGKRCPNCFLVIEKDGGCDSMWCPGCKKHFNWATAASAVPGKGPPAAFVDDRFGNMYNVPQVCEMDALEKAERGGKSGSVDSGIGFSGLVGGAPWPIAA